ncbi:MAG: hypothetical protein AAFV80_21645, partial [Bacteroidota bacterium]
KKVRICKVCPKPVKGRTDKIFCSLTCKNYYHVNLRRVTNIATKDIDKILHRNRSILLEIMGKKIKRKMVHRSFLDQKKFNFDFQTGQYTNAQSKTYHLVYDFAWMPFHNATILITRQSPKTFHKVLPEEKKSA